MLIVRSQPSFSELLIQIVKNDRQLRSVATLFTHIGLGIAQKYDGKFISMYTS
jgi:hypothetical protein